MQFAQLIAEDGGAFELKGLGGREHVALDVGDGAGDVVVRAVLRDDAPFDLARHASDRLVLVEGAADAARRARETAFLKSKCIFCLMYMFRVKFAGESDIIERLWK